MKVLLSVCFFLFFIPFSSNPLWAQAIIEVDDFFPETYLVPSVMRGHNHTAFSPISWYQSADFEKEYRKLYAGIERWPSGNRANNYNWLDHLQTTNEFNLRNAARYMDDHNIDLQIVINFGNGSPSEAAELVRVCNSEKSKYRHLRDSLLDHPEALDVPVWEIGNESTDAWTFAWSWLGYQDKVFFQSNKPPFRLDETEIDSMYYYGGSFFRQGWVKIIGGLDMMTAILGDLHYYTQAQSSDIVKVEFPDMIPGDSNAIRIYRTRNFDLAWAQQVDTQQKLYDSIANPQNILPQSEYDWDKERVHLHPAGGIQAGDLYLIEYLSTNHKGAFEFRDSMKAADPGIKIGYTVKVSPELEAMPGFIDDFRQSPPDFMIDHLYASNITQPALDSGYYSLAAYAAEFKVASAVDLQTKWRERKSSWQLPREVGIGITEWNIALCDLCPTNHPFKGISSALYVADFWARSIEKAGEDSIIPKAFNHFGLIATGGNFIHLFHPNPGGFEVTPEGRAVQMVMKSVGHAFFKPHVRNIPQINIPWKTGFRPVDALSVYGGLSDYFSTIYYLIINRDQLNSHEIKWENVPIGMTVDSVYVETFTGTMIDSHTTFQKAQFYFDSSSFDFSVPRYSISIWGLKLIPIGMESKLVGTGADFRLSPNPASDILRVDGKEDFEEIAIFAPDGKILLRSQQIKRNYTLNLRDWPAGIYYIRATSRSGSSVKSFIKQ